MRTSQQHWNGSTQSQRSVELKGRSLEKEFTEVFSWGSDKEGQLGLGQKMSQGKQIHPNPRFCTYNIPINLIACGENHSVFITTNQLVYSMGSNSSG